MRLFRAMDVTWRLLQLNRAALISGYETWRPERVGRGQLPLRAAFSRDQRIWQQNRIFDVRRKRQAIGVPIHSERRTGEDVRRMPASYGLVARREDAVDLWRRPLSD